MAADEHARYVDLELLGRGGMASVYRAHDTVLGRKVALKALRIDETTRHRDARIAQFHSEYRTLAEIAHPRVIQVYDYGVNGDAPYYTMELLDGDDLSARAPLPWRDACALLRDVCSSLALLHSRGYVHRDVSPLNVRCTADGRAKLIDFGAMAAMGVSPIAIGTPPCVPPEALERQPLDGRADLFALGATLYFTLTGRQAYAARSFNELRMVHERPVRPPSAYATVPPALDRLVLSLLSLDVMARPRHAAEVMDRLTTIAELGPIEPIAVSRAYLNTPALVGREPAIERLRTLLEEARAGHGRAIRIHAARGGGRSRMLNTASVEARLGGMSVLAANASEASAPFGVLRALLRELAHSGEHAASLLRDSPELTAVSDGAQLEVDRTQREVIFNALAQLLGKVCEARPLLIAVDDIEQCDEPSLAALVTLAAKIRKRAIAVAYADTEDAAGTTQNALELLRELSRDVVLPALTLSDLEALLASVFGSVPNLPLASSFIYERTFGNPRACLELAQALVDSGVARYELGSWSLPGQLEAQALPASFLEVRGAKLARLDPDALELAQLLAVAEPQPLSFEDLRVLSLHGDAQRLQASRAALIEARVIAAAEGCALADRTWSHVVRETLSEAPARALHRRLAVFLSERQASPIAIARYWLRADEAVQAVTALCAGLKRGSLVDEAEGDYPELLQECLSTCNRLRRPPLERFLIARELMALSDRVIVKDQGACFRVAIERLRRDSGLADYDALPDTPERLTLALTAAQARYDAAPESERVMAPIDAIRALVEAVYSAAVYAAMIGDMAMLEELPDLAPFEVLSPAISGVRAAIVAQRPLIGARYETALELYAVRLESLETSHAHLTEAQLERARLLLRYTMGSLQAGLGIKGALDYAQALDELPQGAIMAAAVRESYYVRRGNTRSAAEWRRRMELLQVQLKRPHALKMRQTTQQLECSAHADDLEETKRNLEVIEELCEAYPSSVPYVHLGRAEYQRIRGDYASALEHVRLCLSLTEPGRHAAWPWAAASEVDCLRLLQRTAEAHLVGKARVCEARAVSMEIMGDHIEVFLAQVEAELGEFALAVEKLERIIQKREQFGMTGLNVGWAYEVRAVIALHMRDRATFERCLQQCASNYGGGRDNPALAARYERLLQEARAQWKTDERLSLPSGLGPSTLMSSASHMLSRELDASQLVTGIDTDSRTRAAFESLLRAAGRAKGQLFLLRDGGLVCVAGEGVTMEQRVAAEELVASANSDDSGETAEDDADESRMSTGTHAEAARFETVLLSCPRQDGFATVGVLILMGSSEIPPGFYPSMQVICNALIEARDAQPTMR